MYILGYMRNLLIWLCLSFVVTVQQWTAWKKKMCIASIPLGLGYSFHVQRKHKATSRNCSRSRNKNLLFQRQGLLISLEGDARNLAVLANAPWSLKVLAVPWSYGGSVRMATRANGTHQRNMVECTLTTCNSLQQYCYLEITTQR